MSTSAPCSGLHVKHSVRLSLPKLDVVCCSASRPPVSAVLAEPHIHACMIRSMKLETALKALICIVTQLQLGKQCGLGRSVSCECAQDWINVRSEPSQLLSSAPWLRPAFDEIHLQNRFLVQHDNVKPCKADSQQPSCLSSIQTSLLQLSKSASASAQGSVEPPCR